MNRPSEQEKMAMRQLYAAPGKPVAKLYRIYDCGKVVFENEDPALCVFMAQKWGIKAKPTLK